MRIRQIAFFGLLIVVAGGIVSPLITGKIFRQHYYESVAAIQNYYTSINPSPENQIKVSIVEYHESWFKSNAKVSFKITQTMPDVPPRTFEFVVDQHITHGPVIFDPLTQNWIFAQALLRTNVHLPDSVETILLGDQAHFGILQAETIATFDNVYNTKFTVPNINRSANGASIDWKGLTGNMQIVMDGKKLQRMSADSVVGEFTVKGPTGSLSTQKITANYDFAPDVSGLWSGTYHFAMPGFTLNSPKENASLSDFVITDTSHVTGGSYSNQLHFSLGKFVVPEYTLNQSNFDISISDVSAAGLKNLIDTASTASRAQSTDEARNQVLAKIPSVFIPTTHVQGNSTVNTSFGRVVSDWLVNWPTGVTTINDIAANANAKANIRVSISLVNKIIDVLSQREMQKEQASGQVPANSDVSASAVTPTPAAAPAPATQAPAPAAQNQPSEAQLLEHIDNLVKQEKMDVDVGEQLKDLIQTHLNPADFAKNVNGFVLQKEIDKDLADQLVKSYSDVVNAKNNPVAMNAPMQPAPAAPQVQPQPVATVSPADRMKQQIDAFIKAGFITQDKDDYVTTITYENGVPKANGHPLQ